MKANELRIGNWVNPDKPYQIDANSFQNAFNSEFDQDGIPLTEEWLLKFGFSDTNTGGYEIKIEDSICIRIFGNDITILDKFWESVEIDIKLQYIHQLQNLYFALTNAELTIK